MGHAKRGEVEIADGRGPALAGRLERVESDHPALYRGGILRLCDARAPELGPWLDRVAMRGAGGGAVLAQAGRGGGDAGLADALGRLAGERSAFRT